MPDDSAVRCTCWQVPGAFDSTHPAGWLMLQPAVLVRYRTRRGQDDSLVGRLATVLWGGPPEKRERLLLLLDVGEDPVREVGESEIVWVEPAGATDLYSLSTVAGRALGAAIESASVDAYAGQFRGPATALFRLPGRGYVRVDVRRGQHACLPGDDTFAMPSAPSPDCRP